jgi:hypothetical protein
MSVNLDEKVVIKNLCEWDLYFPRIETSGTVKLVKKGINRLTRAEIQAQVFSNNTMFTGTDGRGSNAKIYIDDKKTRVLVGFEDEDGKEKQKILTPERVKEILNLKTLKSFKENISKDVKTQAEKLVLIEEAKKQGLNDYKKIQFIEEYTGYKFEE